MHGEWSIGLMKLSEKNIEEVFSSCNVNATTELLMEKLTSVLDCLYTNYTGQVKVSVWLKKALKLSNQLMGQIKKSYYKVTVGKAI